MSFMTLRQIFKFKTKIYLRKVLVSKIRQKKLRPHIVIYFRKKDKKKRKRKETKFKKKYLIFD